MNTPVTNDVSYLHPLFEAVLPYRSADQMLTLPDPEAGSSLDGDDKPLGPFRVSTIISGSFTAGLQHTDALRRLVVELGVLDAASPWTLLRGALENFSTAVQLLHGTRNDRRTCALALWNEDYRNRHQYEVDTHHVPSGTGKTGQQRQAEVQAVAAKVLGLTRLPKPGAGETIKAAAGFAGLDPERVIASWRLGSGFAHGRQWSTLAGSAPRNVVPAPRGGYIVEYEIADAPLKELASACLALLKCAETQYNNRRIK